MSTFLSGLVFGSSLVLASVHHPSIILDQLRLTNNHMLLSFITASAISALVFRLANKSSFASISHRKNANYGWFGLYDANFIGGGLQGLGMALTGSCPGTVLVQFATGVGGRGRALWIALGALLAGIGFVGYASGLKRNSLPTTTKSQPQSNTSVVKKSDQDLKKQEVHTIQQLTSLSDTSTLITYELCSTLFIALILLLSPSRTQTHPLLLPIKGGVLIGLAQTTSVLFRRSSIGVSSVYEDIGKYFWRSISPSSSPNSTITKPSTSSSLFALGILLGAYSTPFLTSSIPSLASLIPSTTISSPPPTSPQILILGGFLNIFGARLAGGCTSGHGISGLATMSLSSFATVAGMFGAGIIGMSVLG